MPFTLTTTKAGMWGAKDYRIVLCMVIEAQSALKMPYLVDLIQWIKHE